MKLLKSISLKLVTVIIALLVVSILAGCASAPTYPSTPNPPGQTPSPPSAPGGTPVAINLIAKNISFSMSTITVPAGASVTINFDNQDAGIAHNFSLYIDSKATPPALFQGGIVNGPAKTTYQFNAPTTPGTYFFRCDIHPTVMTGSFIVQ